MRWVCDITFLTLKCLYTYTGACPKICIVLQVCEIKNCNKCLYFEAKKKQDLYMWWVMWSLLQFNSVNVVYGICISKFTCLAGFQTALMDLLQSFWFKTVSYFCYSPEVKWETSATWIKVLNFMVYSTVHTLAELKMTGNCLKGSRPLLSFDPVRSTRFLLLLSNV